MSRNPHRLTGKTALITGASRGIGRAVGEIFAAEGANVIINHFRDELPAAKCVNLLKSASQREGHGTANHSAIDADIGSPAEIDRMFAAALKAHPRIDILVNNCGIQSPTPGDTFDEAELLRILHVDLIGAALCARAALAHFVSRPGGGAIINTTSVHEMIPKPGYLAYSIAKGGLGNLTRTLALDFCRQGRARQRRGAGRGGDRHERRLDS